MAIKFNLLISPRTRPGDWQGDACCNYCAYFLYNLNAVAGIWYFGFLSEIKIRIFLGNLPGFGCSEVICFIKSIREGVKQIINYFGGIFHQNHYFFQQKIRPLQTVLYDLKNEINQ